MEDKTTTLPQKARTTMLDIGKQMNDCVLSVLGQEKLMGFERAFQLSEAMGRLKGLLTPDYMKPIMLLQGTKLGFKTDKDREGGYGEEVVKNCLIEAVLMGVQVTGNQFNIIAGNTYITKEGFGHLLMNFAGLSYSIIPSLPNVTATSAAVIMKVEWTLNNKMETKDIPIPIRVNNGMGVDAILGKATRKSRAWLHSTITGTEISEGDATENGAATVINSKPLDATDKDAEQDWAMLKDCKTIAEIQELLLANPDISKDLADKRISEIEKA